MLTGLLAAIFFHGTFDFFIFWSQQPNVDTGTGNTMLAGGALVSFIVSLVLCRKMIIHDQVISKQMYKNNKPPDA
ncbi:MAG TPA: hypothetical protein VET23_12015 [Chitinophagaceae bacterium]|nr:hypothetical protein [Chitinophagaceae bacterium]